jgi:negative regulator of sigma E activity
MTERLWRGLEADDTDAAIDRAVREILDHEPAAGFRQRVLARLQREPNEASWLAAWLTPVRLTAAAAAAGLVLAVMLWTRPAAPPADAPVVAQKPATADPLPQSQPKSPQPTPAANDVPAAANRRLARQQPPATAPGRTSDRRVAAASVTPAEEAAERDAARSVAPIDPITIPPLRVQPLEHGEILIAPVVVGPLKIVPLPPPR